MFVIISILSDILISSYTLMSLNTLHHCQVTTDYPRTCLCSLCKVTYSTDSGRTDRMVGLYEPHNMHKGSGLRIL